MLDTHSFGPDSFCCFVSLFRRQRVGEGGIAVVSLVALCDGSASEP